MESAALRAFLQQAGVKFDGVEGSSLVFDGSAMLVTQTPRNMARIRTILTRYAAVRQVEIEAKFLEVEDGALEELGVNWNASRRVDPMTGNSRELYQSGNRSVAGAFGGSASGSAIRSMGHRWRACWRRRCPARCRWGRALRRWRRSADSSASSM